MKKTVIASLIVFALSVVIHLPSLVNAASTVSGSSLSSGSLTLTSTDTPVTYTTGVINLDATAGVTQFSGQDIAITFNGDYAGSGSKITLTSGADVTGMNEQNGSTVYLAGTSSVTSGGIYIGHATYTSGSTDNAAYYIGNRVGFSDDSGGIDITGDTGATAYMADITSTADGADINGFSGNFVKTGSGGSVSGISMNVTNSTAAADHFKGIEMTLDVSGNPSDSNGIYIFESGGTGTVEKGIWIGSTRNTGSAPYAIATGLDVSDQDIQYAMNVGANTILATDSFSIDISTGHGATLTLTNSDGSNDASLAIEGGLTIGTGGVTAGTKITKHLSNSASWDPADIATSASTSTTITVTGAALGDTVAVGLSTNTTAGMQLTGSVTSANTVTVTLGNLSGGNVNLASGTLRADVWQH